MQYQQLMFYKFEYNINIIITKLGFIRESGNDSIALLKKTGSIVTYSQIYQNCCG